MSRVILHAGTHKTGTTSIQVAMHSNREWLRERGYIYPKTREGLPDHNDLAQALALDGQDGFDVRPYFDALGGHTLILSAEEFWATTARPEDWQEFERADYWERRVEYLRRVRAALGRFDGVDVFLCFRRQDEFAASLYATKILSRRFLGSFDEFRACAKPLFDYRRQLQAFREVFGEVRYTSYSAMKAQLVPAFCQWTGIPLPPAQTDEYIYATPDARLVQWFYKHRTLAEPKHMSKMRRSFAMSEEAAGLLPAQGQAAFWASDTERRAFLTDCVDPEPGFFARTDATVSNDQDCYCVADEKVCDLGRIDQAFDAWLASQGKQRQRGPRPDKPPSRAAQVWSLLRSWQGLKGRKKRGAAEDRHKALATPSR